MKIVTVIGARPQIIKAAALSRAIRQHFSKEMQEVIVHTGQHYDNNMSQVFFDELDIPQPQYNIGVGSDSHGVQTAKMIEGIEKILLKEKPDCIVLYGDTNSTLAGAIAASKIHVPIVHIEAGLRSFNKSMPEEINRICTDHVSALLLASTRSGYDEMKREGIYADQLTDQFISNVYKSAPLHDVGKISVPDAILNKPGKLTDEEFAIMKSHTTEGWHILEKIEENASDSMDDDYLKELQSRPGNVTLLTLRPDEDKRYRGSRKTLESWIADGTLKQDDDSSYNFGMYFLKWSSSTNKSKNTNVLVKLFSILFPGLSIS